MFDDCASASVSECQHVREGWNADWSRFMLEQASCMSYLANNKFGRPEGERSEGEGGAAMAEDAAAAGRKAIGAESHASTGP
jgi:hypothetical protein